MKATRKTIVTAVLTASMAVSAIPFSASAIGGIWAIPEMQELMPVSEDGKIFIDQFSWDLIYEHDKFTDMFKKSTLDESLRDICGGDYTFFLRNPEKDWYPSYREYLDAFCIDEFGKTHKINGYFTEVMIKVKADTELPLDEIKAVTEENGYNLPTFEKTETGYRMINADDRKTTDFVMEQIKACDNVLAIDNHYAVWDNPSYISSTFIRGINYNGDITVEELAEKYPSLDLYVPQTEEELRECEQHSTGFYNEVTNAYDRSYERTAFLPIINPAGYFDYTPEQLSDIKKLLNSDLDFFIYPRNLADSEVMIDVHYSSIAGVPVYVDGLKGDANIDGEKNMADAVMIMQSVANPDKYGIKAVNGITAQGSQNGDMDGNGITNADALAIQMDILNVR